MYNLAAYAIYTMLVCTIILYVGHYCYRYGATYLVVAIPHDPHQAAWINKLLLVGYYLLNIGIGIYLVSTWPLLPDGLAVLRSVLRQVSNLIFLLGVMHHINLFIINILFLDSKT
ncbi:MAG: hypothetical protein WBA16_05275 [Nonlabens sp.]